MLTFRNFSNGVWTRHVHQKVCLYGTSPPFSPNPPPFLKMQKYTFKSNLVLLTFLQMKFIQNCRQLLDFIFRLVQFNHTVCYGFLIVPSHILITNKRTFRRNDESEGCSQQSALPNTLFCCKSKKHEPNTQKIFHHPTLASTNLPNKNLNKKTPSRLTLVIVTGQCTSSARKRIAIWWFTLISGLDIPVLIRQFTRKAKCTVNQQILACYYIWRSWRISYFR